MVVLRSGKKSGSDNCSSSSVANKSDGATDRRRKIRHAQAILPLHPLPLKTRSVKNKNKPYPVFQYATQALKGFNGTSPQKYQLLKVGSFTPVSMPKCVLYHINFTAKHADVAAAPEEMFFTELTISPPDGLNIRLCVSLGPTNSISGVRLNGCYICRNYYNLVDLFVAVMAFTKQFKTYVTST